jgi:hypothetical protein
MPWNHKLVGGIGEPEEPKKEKEDKSDLIEPGEFGPFSLAHRDGHIMDSPAWDQDQKEVPEDGQDVITVDA